MIYRSMKRGIHFMRIMAATIELPNFIITPITHQCFQFGGIENRFSYIGAIFGFHRLVLTVNDFAKALEDQPLCAIPFEPQLYGTAVHVDSDSFIFFDAPFEAPVLAKNSVSTDNRFFTSREADDNLAFIKNELAAKGLITSFEVVQLQRNEGILKLIRCRLHLVAGRREDRLVFDLQTAVAESFGFHASGSERASEVLMHRYYWAAKAVTQLNQILLLNIEDHLRSERGEALSSFRPLNERFFEKAGFLEVARPLPSAFPH